MEISLVIFYRWGYKDSGIFTEIDIRNSCMMFSKFGISCARRPLLRLGRWPPEIDLNNSPLWWFDYIPWAKCFHSLAVLPSWLDDWSLSSSIALIPPPIDDINNDEIRSFSRWLSNSPGISTSSLLLVLRLLSLEPFGGSSSMKPPAHNGHVYSWKKIQTTK